MKLNSSVIEVKSCWSCMAAIAASSTGAQNSEPEGPLGSVSSIPGRCSSCKFGTESEAGEDSHITGDVPKILIYSDIRLISVII